jgi:hypothetical protein
MYQNANLSPTVQALVAQLRSGRQQPGVSRSPALGGMAGASGQAMRAGMGMMQPPQGGPSYAGIPMPAQRPMAPGTGVGGATMSQPVRPVQSMQAQLPPSLLARLQAFRNRGPMAP